MDGLACASCGAAPVEGLAIVCDVCKAARRAICEPTHGTEAEMRERDSYPCRWCGSTVPGPEKVTD